MNTHIGRIVPSSAMSGAESPHSASISAISIPQPDRINAGPWIVRFRPSAHKFLRLICFPYAGGGASVFRQWQDDLPEQIDLCSVLLPGRESRLREAPIREMSLLLDALLEGIRTELQTPYAFFGHSLGALLAFEITRRLRSHSIPLPVHLFVSASDAPQFASNQPRRSEMPEAALIEELQDLNGTPDEVLKNGDILACLLPTLRSDFALYESYVFQPGNLLDVPITAFGGKDDTTVKHDSLVGWQDLTRGAFNLDMLPGGHFFIKNQQDLFLEVLSKYLRCSLG